MLNEDLSDGKRSHSSEQRTAHRADQLAHRNQVHDETVRRSSGDDRPTSTRKGPEHGFPSLFSSIRGKGTPRQPFGNKEGIGYVSKNASVDALEADGKKLRPSTPPYGLTPAKLCSTLIVPCANSCS